MLLCPCAMVTRQGCLPDAGVLASKSPYHQQSRLAADRRHEEVVRMRPQRPHEADGSW